MARLSLSLLGTFQATLDGEPIAGFESVKVRALLAYLAVEADRPHHRGSLAGLLWPDRPDRSARANLRHALSVLRKAIADHQVPPPHLSITRETVQFNPASDCWTDVEAFTALVEADRRPDSAGPRPTPHLPDRDPRLTQLERAIAFYRGRFLEGLSVGDSPAFEDWALLLRERLQRQAASALHQLSQAHAARGNYAQACGYARRWLALEPWQEEAHQGLMRLLALSGQRSAALAQYEACCRALAEELDVEPTEETVQLYERIRDGEDLSDFPQPDRSPYGSPTQPPRQSNLPAPLTPFVGRKALLDEVAERLEDPACRLLTLTGPGGSGKTRLALESAGAQLEAHPDGVYWVSLAPLGSAEAIVPTLAQAIGFTFYAPTDGGSGAPRQQLLAYLRRKRMLLVLDNAEHLPGATRLAADILVAAPQVKLLVTSRARLSVPGEHLLPVRGMDVPPASRDRAGTGGDDGHRYSAVQLFAESARRMQPAFALDEDNLAPVTQICRAVGGLPLGILLAAAWMQMLSPAEIARELTSQDGKGLDLLATDWQKAPPRQHSMRAVFDHSWRLLSDREREAMQALSVFRGGCTREAAQQVTGASLRELMALVQQSLLERTPAGRYEMHELLRQYAAEKLAASPDGGNAPRDRHAAYYAAALDEWAADLKGHRQSAALEELGLEIEDARAAWAWALERGQLALLDEALEGLCLFLCLRSRCQDREAALHALAEMLDGSAASGAESPRIDVLGASTPEAGATGKVWTEGPAPTQAEERRALTLVRVLSAQASCTLHQPSPPLLHRAQMLLDRIELGGGDVRPERASVLYLMGRAAKEHDRSQTKRLYERSLALYQALDMGAETATAMYSLGEVATYLGAYGEAGQWVEGSLSIRRTLGDRSEIARSLSLLGTIALHQGRLEDGERLVREAWAIFKEIWGVHPMGWTLGWVLCARGRFADALRELEENRAQRVERGAPTAGHVWLAAVKAHLGLYDEARADGEQALAVSRAEDVPQEIGLSLLTSSWPALAEGAYAQAEALLRESVAMYQNLGQVDQASWAEACMGYAERGLGRCGAALQHALAALRAGVEIHAFFPLMFGLPLAALLIADEGQTERAVEAHALVSRYAFVANSRWFGDIAGREIAAAAATLAPDVVATARERGRAKDLWAEAEELLAELEATVQDEEG
jgi:DNA-binding SARP family transcriptional activator/predicted ATPase